MKSQKCKILMRVRNRRFQTKAQTASQIFTYIIAVVIIGIIFVFGIQAIQSLLKRGQDITEVRFQRELTSSIKTISSRNLDVDVKTFQLSGDYYQACFIRNYEPHDPSPDEFNGYPLIKNAFDSGANDNLFLVEQDGSVKEKLTVSAIAFDDDSMFKCFRIYDSELTLRLEGRGDHTIISEK